MMRNGYGAWCIGIWSQAIQSCSVMWWNGVCLLCLLSPAADMMWTVASCSSRQ